MPIERWLPLLVLLIALISPSFMSRLSGHLANNRDRFHTYCKFEAIHFSVNSVLIFSPPHNTNPLQVSALFLSASADLKSASSMFIHTRIHRSTFFCLEPNPSFIISTLLPFLRHNQQIINWAYCFQKIILCLHRWQTRSTTIKLFLVVLWIDCKRNGDSDVRNDHYCFFSSVFIIVCF